jgi:hypothetical protein
MIHLFTFPIQLRAGCGEMEGGGRLRADSESKGLSEKDISKEERVRNISETVWSLYVDGYAWSVGSGLMKQS